VTSTVKGFRLDDETLTELGSDSRKRRITMSNHVCNILTNYNGSYRHLERLHYVWSSRELITELIKNIDSKCLEKLSEILARDLKKQIRYSLGEFDAKAIMQTIESNCLIQDIPFTEKDLQSGSVRYTLFHELGKNWTSITKMVIDRLLKNTNTRVTDFDGNGDYMSFTINYD